MLRTAALTALSLCALTAVTAPAAAEPQRYEFDKPHTQILFFADHMGFSKSHGEFMEFDGHFTFDQSAPENSSVEVAIKTDSIRMKTEKWEDHLKNEDFFNVTEYPEMTFKSTGITVTGDDTADLAGDLTMLGQTHPVTLHVKHNKSAPHPFKANTYMSGFEATATIDRATWGMTYGTPMMSSDVEIRINVEGIADNPEGAPNE